MAPAFALSILTACTAPVPQGIVDPNEANNRLIHEFNKSVDRVAVRPLADAYGDAAPGAVRTGLSNFAGNLAIPGHVANNILQLRLGDAIENTARFVVNTTAGVGGLFDPARAIGMGGNPTDFGETLHVWGAGEGNYVELPFIGPSTERDMAGMTVDFFLDPLWFVLPPTEAAVAVTVQAASGLNSRERYSETIDSVLYDSADSYAQTRLLYLQNRRFELGQASENEDFVDPYEDPYAE